MGEITVKDALEYFKWEMTEMSRSYFTGTLQRSSLVLIFTISCFVTWVTYENSFLRDASFVGLLAGIAVNIIGFHASSLMTRKYLHIQKICNKILSGEITSAEQAIAEYLARPKPFLAKTQKELLDDMNNKR